ncbi:MAG: hypothetical protein Q9180_000696 [Flavoplaca navasiana]
MIIETIPKHQKVDPTGGEAANKLFLRYDAWLQQPPRSSPRNTSKARGSMGMRARPDRSSQREVLQESLAMNTSGGGFMDSTRHHSPITAGAFQGLPPRDSVGEYVRNLVQGSERMSPSAVELQRPSDTTRPSPESPAHDPIPTIERSSRAQSQPLIRVESLLPGSLPLSQTRTFSESSPTAMFTEVATSRRRTQSDPEVESLSRPRPQAVFVLRPDQLASLRLPSLGPRTSPLADLVSPTRTIWGWCNDMIVGGIMFGRNLMKVLYEISSLLAYIAGLLFGLLALLVVVFAIWSILWALGKCLNILDEAAMVSCQWTLLRPLCTFVCGKASGLGLYMFSSTCAPHAAYNKFNGPYAEPDYRVINGMGDISHLLLHEQSRCMEFKAGFPKIRTHVSISEEDKEILTANNDGLCSFLLRMSEAVPGHFQYVNIFAKTVLRDAARTGQRIQNALEVTDSRGQLLEQRLINEKVEQFVKSWLKQHQFLAEPGRALAAEIIHHRHKNSETHSILKKALSEAQAARRNVIKEWPLSVRLGRWFGLLRSNPIELYDYDESVNLLARWVANTAPSGPLENVLQYLGYNVSNVNVDLGSLATTRFSADFQFEMGANGLREAQEWFQGLETDVKGIGDGRNKEEPPNTHTGG